MFGQHPARLGRPALFAMRRRVGMLFQNGALMSDLDVFENVAFPLRAHTRLPEPLLRRLVLMKLQAVGLRGAAELAPTSFPAAWPVASRSHGRSSWIRNC